MNEVRWRSDYDTDLGEQAGGWYIAGSNIVSDPYKILRRAEGYVVVDWRKSLPRPALAGPFKTLDEAKAAYLMLL